MKRSRVLYKILADCKAGGNDVYLSVIGIFDTTKVHWSYYVLSYYNDAQSNLRTSEDICGLYGTIIDTDSVRRYGKEFPTLEEGKVYIDEYILKWKTGSNSTLEEKRDKKLNDILGEET